MGRKNDKKKALAETIDAQVKNRERISEMDPDI